MEPCTPASLEKRSTHGRTTVCRRPLPAHAGVRTPRQARARSRASTGARARTQRTLTQALADPPRSAPIARADARAPRRQRAGTSPECASSRPEYAQRCETARPQLRPQYAQRCETARPQLRPQYAQRCERSGPLHVARPLPRAPHYRYLNQSRRLVDGRGSLV
jgi:hypothetical protein